VAVPFFREGTYTVANGRVSPLSSWIIPWIPWAERDIKESMMLIISKMDLCII
jgi:hypothetical protein